MKNNTKKTGVYIHIPFCESKCGYCDFTSFSGKAAFYEDYKNALITEIKGTIALENRVIETIFIGGGTPSILPSDFIEEIMELFSAYKLSDTAEITIEANPNSLSRQKLIAYKKAGVNRLSIGLQAWQNSLLERLGRVHRLTDFLSAFENAREAGYHNISVDLMFAIPGQTLEDWNETLHNIAALQPEHISAYSLIVEENTRFYDDYMAGRLAVCEEKLDRQMYDAAKQALRKAGFVQYEISNFAKSDFLSRHNVLYWVRDNYLGFGLATHSFLDGMRYSNCNDLNFYIENSVNIHKIRASQTVVTINEAMEEFMFLGLRLTEGVALKSFYSEFGADMYSIYGRQIEKNVKRGLLTYENGRLRLTSQGVDLSNMVMADFIL